MIHVAIYENQTPSITLKNLLEGLYSDMLEDGGSDRIQVDAFVTTIPNNPNEISMENFSEGYFEGIYSAIIFPKEYHMAYNSAVLELLRLGIDTDDIFNSRRLYNGIENSPEQVATLLTPMFEDPYLSYLEFHVVDHCNLNCKYCTHYSPLVNEPVYTDINVFKNDLRKLREYIVDIGIIRILGGEPLLSPDLPEYIEYIRGMYPGSLITIVTNGLLIDKIDAPLKEAMRKHKAFFHISYYPPLEPKMNAMQEFLVKEKIPFTTSPLIKEFNKSQTLSKQNAPEVFYKCMMATCHCIHNGKLSPCYAPFTTKYFNDAFGQSIPEDEGLDLYDPELTLEKIKTRLILPMERCCYCTQGEACPWEVVGKNSKLEDWV